MDMYEHGIIWGLYTFHPKCTFTSVNMYITA